ncbi:hypothetical protein, partial [Pelomonas sp. Root1444]|uniref:hypothetical protein n=1 Tax=Pelomonas sp. Root1444 TaxID=1736464 RepID=UPI00138F0BB4
VFLKISFLDTQQLCFFLCRLILFAFAFSRQQQRGEILICFRSVVKRFLKNSLNFSALADSLKPACQASRPAFARPAPPPFPAAAL